MTSDLPEIVSDLIYVQLIINKTIPKWLSISIFHYILLVC